MNIDRPRRLVPTTLAIASVAVLALTTAGCDGRSASAGPPTSGGPPTTVGTPTTVGAPTSGAGSTEVLTGTSGTTAALSKYTWHTLPNAPITARDDAAGVWTGTQLLVWGGDVNLHRYFADGAAYDPSTRTWTKLPKSPLSARANPAYVWTGTQLLIWGGTHGSHNLTDGALYDPSARTWTKLPKAPVASYGWAGVYRVGAQIALLSTRPARSVGAIRAALYNPAANSWHRLASLQLPNEQPALGVEAVSAGPRLFVLSEWSFEYRGREGGGSLVSGVDGYTFDPTADQVWRANHVEPPQGRTSDQPLWTGKRVLLPSLDVWCGDCPGPFLFNRTGVVINPANGKRSKIVHGPVDDLGATYTWTGSALLAVDSTTEISGPDTHTYPGEAAVWNPHTRRWTQLPNAPVAGGQAVVHVWTGTSELIWGRLYNRHSLSQHSGIELASARSVR